MAPILVLAHAQVRATAARAAAAAAAGAGTTPTAASLPKVPSSVFAFSPVFDMDGDPEPRSAAQTPLQQPLGAVKAATGCAQPRHHHHHHPPPVPSHWLQAHQQAGAAPAQAPAAALGGGAHPPAGLNLDRSMSDLQVHMMRHGLVSAAQGDALMAALPPTLGRLLQLLKPQSDLEAQLTRCLRSMRGRGPPAAAPGAAPPVAFGAADMTAHEMEALAQELLAAGYLVQVRRVRQNGRGPHGGGGRAALGGAPAACWAGRLGCWAV